ncbi:Nup93/Nic96-domain-containing protein [Morchella snyderi]|nr:Nup93/Nic96-domain-containing protein [Morchella snyderi]
MAATEPANHVSSLFSSLLEQSRKLRQETDNDGLETVQLGLNELERRAKDLKKTREGAQTDARAHYLLAAGGINTDEALRDLDSIDFQNAYEPSTIRVDTDIDTYLRNRREQNVMSSIEDGMRRTSRDFDAFVAKNVTIEWEAQKQRIFEHFGLTPRNATAPSATADTFNGGLSAFGASSFGVSSFGRSKLGQSFGPGVAGRGSVWAKSTMGTSVLGRPTAANTTGASTAKLFTDVDPARQNDMSRQVQLRQKQFSAAVKRLNEVRLENGADGGIYPVMKVFGDITGASGNDMLTLQLYDSWKLLGSITNESDIRDGNPFGGPHERQFRKDYILNTSPDSAEASRMRKTVQKGARRFLEKQFLEMVERSIAENPQIAKVGGIPSVFHKFRGYINVKLANNKDLPEWDLKNFDYVSDVPCWAIIFYLLRAGFLEEADEFVRQNQQSFQKLDRSFPTYLHAYCSAGDERRLPRNLLDRIQGEYNNRVRHSEDTQDIFKPAVYKIIGRCDLSKRSVPNVMPTAEDWMWLQLVLAREIDKTTEPAHEVFTLTDLQKGVLQFGAKHFSQKGSNVGLYFQMLMMSGLFEDAVHYLYSFQYVDGVHFAIALTYYGLLRPTSNPASVGGELLTLGQNGERQINFPRLIGYYTNDFRTPNAEEAVDYISLLCLNADLPAPTGPNHLTICHESLRELVLDTKEFTKLLGDVRADGTREKGAIEKRMRLIMLTDQREYLRTITEQAAVQADDDGRANDAVLLYHLAEDYDTVLQIINKNLSDSIASEETPTHYQDHTAASGVLDSSLSLTSVEDPVKLAQNMLKMYGANVSVYTKIVLRNREACGVLLQIAEAKRLFTNGDWESCLVTIEGFDVIPLDRRVDVGSIRRRAQNFSTLHETVSRNVGLLLKMVVECCHRLSIDIRNSLFADASRDQKLVELKARTKSAMIYAGMIQYKLPAHVYEFINSRDVTDGF